MPVNFRGKDYQTVLERLEPAHGPSARPVGIKSILTEVRPAGQVTAIYAAITFEDGRVFSGMSEIKFDATSGADKDAPLECAECVPLDSQILTEKGWRLWSEVKVGDLVLTYDRDADCLVWTPLLRVTTMVQAQHLKTNHRIVLAATAPDGPLSLSTRDAALWGWLITDGSWQDHGTYVRASISQSKPRTIEVLRRLLAGIATERKTDGYYRTFPTGKTYWCQPAVHFDLPARFMRGLLDRAGLQTREEASTLPLRLTHEGRQAMLEAMMQADGTGGGFRRSRVFGKGKPWVMDTFRLLGTLEGYALGKPSMSSGDVIPVQSLKVRRFVSASETHMEYVGDMPVWCPTTFYGTWVMRQGDRITITGNTSAVGRALQFAGYYGSDDGLAGAEEVRTATQRRENRERAPGVATNGAARVNADLRPRPAPVVHEPWPQDDAPHPADTPTPIRQANGSPGGPPATPKQLETLAKFRITPDAGLTRARASELISAAIGAMGEGR